MLAAKKRAPLRVTTRTIEPIAPDYYNSEFNYLTSASSAQYYMNLPAVYEVCIQTKILTWWVDIWVERCSKENETACEYLVSKANRLLSDLLNDVD